MAGEKERFKLIEKLYFGNSDGDSDIITIQTYLNFKVLKQDDKPDLKGTHLGLEHTEVSPFFEGRRGNTYLKYNRSLAESRTSIELDYLNFTFIDITKFLRKLNILKSSHFKMNIIRAIKKKSQLFAEYEKYLFNGLWLEIPDYVSFDNNDVISYLADKEIAQELIDSPFDFFVFGTKSASFCTTKQTFKIITQSYPNPNRWFNLDLQKTDGMWGLEFKNKKGYSINVHAHIETSNQCYFAVNEDIRVLHIQHFWLEFEKEMFEDEKYVLYSDDVELDIVNITIENGMFNIIFTHSELSGRLTTNFSEVTELMFENLTMQPGELLSLKHSQYDALDKQKILTGVKRLIHIQKASFHIWTSVPAEISNFTLKESS